MRNFTRFLTATLAAVLVSATAVTASAAKFTDVTAEDDEYLYNAVDLLNYVGVVKGVSETEYGKDELVTREQMAAFIYRLMKKGKSLEAGANSTTFTDLEDPTFFGMISWASSKGIIKGTSATTFDPKGSITLQDAYTMLVRALGYENEETLPYPFGFIEVAESEGVDLDEGLDSSVEYGDALTRGDTAILLYNAFFAETGVPETTQRERLLGKGTDAATWVLETKTDYPTFCEKYFDVVEAQYQVVATPHFAVNGNEETLDFGYNAVYFELDEDNTDDTSNLPEYFYWDYDELQIEGKADDQIMGNFTLYVTVDEDDNEIDSILYAEPLMTKKTVNDIQFKEVTGNTKKSYMVEGDTDSAKVLSGEIIVDGKAAYFYDAPYSYLKPTYSTSEKEAQYLLRNEDNLRIIERDVIDADDETFTYNVYSGITPADLTATVFPDASEEIMNKFLQAYVGGLYEATFYDVDGDGRYEYIEYLPYEFAVVDTDDDYDFASDGIEMDGETPVVYTNEANIELPEGVDKLKDDDFVIGYFDQNCNYIKVAAVVEPVTGSVKDISKAGKTVTLSNGETVSVDKGWRLVANYNKGLTLGAYDYILDDVDDAFDKYTAGPTNLLTAAIYDADDAKYYVYGGAILFTGDISTSKVLGKDIVILTEDEDGEWFNTGSFSKTTGKREYYAYAWIDGKLGWITVETDTEVTDVFPKIGNASYDTYVDRVAQYTVDGNGIYTVTPLVGAEDEDGESLDFNYVNDVTLNEVIDEKEDEELQAYGYYEAATLTKSIGKRFFLEDNASGDKITVTLTKDTVIVIKNTDEDGDVEFETFNYNTLTDSFNGELTNVQFVIGADVNYTNRANLIFLYAEGDQLDIDSKIDKESDRIVKLMDPKLDSDGQYVYYYTLLNPYTGAQENAYGVKTSSKAFDAPLGYGYIAELNTQGKVEDKNASVVSKYFSITGAKRYWVVDYEAENNVIEVCDVADEESEHFTLYVKGTPVSKIGSTGRGLGADLIKWENIAPSTIDKLGTQPKDLLAACTNYFDPDKANAKQETKYAKYIEAYIDIDWEDEDDTSVIDEDTRANGEANYIVILVHNISSGDVERYCDLDK